MYLRTKDDVSSAHFMPPRKMRVPLILFLVLVWLASICVRVFIYESDRHRLCEPLSSRTSWIRVWVKVSQSCPTLCHPMDCSPWSSPGQNTGVCSLSLLQGIFPNQGSNPGLPPCRQILYQFSHKGTPRILGWAAYPFSSRSSWPRNWTGVSALQADSLPPWYKYTNGWLEISHPIIIH